MLWPLSSSVMRRLTRAACIGFGWPLLILVSALGLQGPLAARPASSPKPIRTWTGVASWYGPRFQGRRTASGQPYDMFAPTAAHPWLPFGSLIRVVNLKTGHSQLVRINDRGPAIDDRELDVSFLAASRLGLLDRGVARVRIELLEEPTRP
jgi:rare lipoprotein A (peptidoglycan hydrolase)